MTDRARCVAAVAAAGLVVAAALVVAPGAAQAKSALGPKDALAELKSGMPLDGVTIRGTVDLKGQTFDQPFECTNCRFKGVLKARNAIFNRPVDLAGSTFANADFTLATFGDLADFEGAEFKNATFVLARFRGDAIFAGPGSFETPPSFGRTSFGGSADFRNRTFMQPPDFARATFSGRSDFGDSVFSMGGAFNGARFGTETTFLGATFGETPCTRIDEPKKPTCAMTVFDNVRSAGAIDFSSVKIPGTLVVTKIDVAGLIFSNTIFEKSPCDPPSSKCEEADGQLRLDDIRAPDFFIDISSLDHVVLSDRASTGHSRREVLGLLESSAKAQNNLALANDAHYRLQSLKSNDYWAPFHWADVFFYQWIAGYLVRPDHPIFTLLSLAVLVSLLRLLLFVPEPPPAPEAGRVRRAWPERIHRLRGKLSRVGRAILRMLLLRRAGSWVRRRLWPAAKDFGHELLDTFRLIWPGSGATAKGRRLEAFAYRVLFVCMLIGFANSNPTLRQILDAVL